jgi:hypothetical protein
MAVMNPERGGETITRLLQVRSITELPAFGQVLEKHHEQTAAIEAEPFIQTEKQKRKAAVRDATVSALDRELEKAIAARMREFDQQEGQARAAARGDEWLRGAESPTQEEARREERSFRRDQALTSEWSLLLVNVPNINDHEALEQLAEDAKLVNNPKIYRSAMTAILQQAGRLAAVERRKNPAGPIGRASIAHSRISAEFDAWRRANPTPTEKLKQIANARQLQENELRRSAQLYRRAYGLDSAY